ncbi:putative cysteine desulfurase [bacterium BMS3Abin02]|nr:putative cysteine desulfurase [bacterium BMS3Abin02]GBE20737.1 putative cysteine desulfurase [bacterium BMS3Bbin01]
MQSARSLYHRSMATEDLIELIRSSVVGADTAIDGPFGPRRVTYADYTASGKPLSFIESYIRDVVLPFYANTHTETSGTGLQTTRFREEARSIIKRCLGGNDDEHAVIFCGSGSTGAIDKLTTILGIRIPAELDERHHLTDHIPSKDRPVVFVGPYEHHSNELPWLESIADVVEIREDDDGHVDLGHLETMLVEYRDRPLRIGSFSAASNVTGIITDASAVSSLLHRHGALSFWDFAAAAPYVAVELRSPNTHGDDYKDAVFVSPHKFIGGPQTPGVLAVRRDLLHNRVPSVPGGGTVSYVSSFEHHYLRDQEHREEGGTPAIIESIRAGLVFQLKETVGPDEIRRRESAFIRRAIDSWRSDPNIRILGNPDADRLSIVSFELRAPERFGDDRWLHHNYVVALLNDLFGIQARGGCSCAGPYGHRLLGIDSEMSRRLEMEVEDGCEVIKPGWARVNFNYFIAEEEFSYIVEAVHLIANGGWRVLSRYNVDPATAVWRHRAETGTPPMALADIAYEGAAMTYPKRRLVESLDRLPTYLSAARRILGQSPVPFDGEPIRLSPSAEAMRWFPLPSEVPD